MNLFSEILGQERALRLLRSAIRSQKIASGYLLTGPAGVGKSLCATAFAMSMMCQTRKEGESEACRECDACQKILRNTHPDFHHLVPDGAFLKIGQVRGLQQKLSLRAHEGKAKIAVLEEVEKMHPTAANALLKILEEPPSGTYFFLLAKSPRFVLPTIRSRCQSVPFVPLQEEIIENFLLKKGAEPKIATFASRFAEGSLGRAMQFLENSLKIRQKLDKVKQFEIAVRAIDPQLGLKAAETLAKGNDRKETMEVLDLLALFYRDVACASAGKTELQSYLEEKETLQTVANTIGLRRALSCVEATLLARDSLSRFGNSVLVLENLVLSLRQYTKATRSGRNR